MVKTIYICDKCKREDVRLCPYPKLSMFGFDIEVKLKEDSLCRDCLKKLIKMIDDYGKEEENEKDY